MDFLTNHLPSTAHSRRVISRAMKRHEASKRMKEYGTLPIGALASNALASSRSGAGASTSVDAPLKTAAMSFEAAFVAEMLSHAGFGASREAFGGGAGEDAFASMLTREMAEELTRSGGFGLSDKIYEALLMRTNADV